MSRLMIDLLASQIPSQQINVPDIELQEFDAPAAREIMDNPGLNPLSYDQASRDRMANYANSNGLSVPTGMSANGMAAAIRKQKAAASQPAESAMPSFPMANPSHGQYSNSPYGNDLMDLMRSGMVPLGGMVGWNPAAFQQAMMKYATNAFGFPQHPASPYITPINFGGGQQ